MPFCWRFAWRFAVLHVQGFASEHPVPGNVVSAHCPGVISSPTSTALSPSRSENARTQRPSSVLTPGSSHGSRLTVFAVPTDGCRSQTSASTDFTRFVRFNTAPVSASVMTSLISSAETVSS